jgi:hypothetical protein
MKEYQHHFRHSEKVSEKIGDRVIEALTIETFPNIEARFAPYLENRRRLKYFLPTLGGLNEFSTSMISYDNINFDIYLNLKTSGVFGDIINKKLKEALRSFNFTEEGKPLFKEVSLYDLLTKRKNTFHLKTANETIEEIVQSLQTGNTESRCLDEVTNPELGIYLETAVNRKAIESKSNFQAKYFSQAKKLEISKR